MTEHQHSPTTILYKRYLNDYEMLFTTHNLFLALQTGHQLVDDLGFSFTDLQFDIDKYHEKPQTDLANDIEARFSLWRQILEKFDGQITVAQMRLHFENLGLPNPSSLGHLLGFYLTKGEKADEERDKVDLIVTRWGRHSFQTREHQTLLFPSPLLREQIEEIYHKFNLKLMPMNELEIGENFLERERKQLLTVRSLRELVESQILVKLRQIKGEIGHLFYQPAILADIVALNVTLHNVFQDLFLAEETRLKAFLHPANSEEQKVSDAAEAFASIIEKPILNETTEVNPYQFYKVGSDREGLLEIVNSMREMIMILDKNLVAIVQRLSQDDPI